MAEKKNENLALYNRVREVPQEAKKDITAGRLKGKTDINPLWRIQTLTREFGPAGIGWYTEIVEKRIEESGGEKALYLHLRLFVKMNGEWSAPIEGFGGAMIVSKEKGGIGADVYWANDATKYQQEKAQEETREQAIEYLQGLNSIADLTAAWEYYKPYLGNDKEFRAAFAKRQKEVTDGIKK